MNADWEKIIERLPGVLLRDQHPEGSGIAVSVEKTEGQWRVHYAKEAEGGFKIRHGAPVTAQGVYEKLRKLFQDAGFVPVLNESELAILGLPHLEEVQSSRLIQKMPGYYLGSQDGMESGMAWGVHYSVRKNEGGDYTLYSCIECEEENALPEPEIEALGAYSLAVLWEETHSLGLRLEHYPFFAEITVNSWKEAAKAMPGRLLQSDRCSESDNLVSAAESRDGKWNLFYAVPESQGVYSLKAILGLEAKEFYKKSFEWLKTVLKKSDAEALRLPPLTELFGEALEKKMKGRFLGGISGIDESGRPCEIFVSVKKEKDETWIFQIADARDLLDGSRKILVRKIGSFHAVERNKMIEALLERGVDLLELLFLLQEATFPEALELAALLKEYLEK
ncbi:MAG: hypothetical protein AB1656_24530 [Candidatus Omnitrophota bacterium]